MKLSTVIKAAEEAKSILQMNCKRVLAEIISNIKIVNKCDLIFINELDCEVSAVDGFILNDKDSNTYPVQNIVEIINKQGFITVTQIKELNF